MVNQITVHLELARACAQRLVASPWNRQSYFIATDRQYTAIQIGSGAETNSAILRRV